MMARSVSIQKGVWTALLCLAALVGGSVNADDHMPPATVKLLSAVEALQAGTASRIGLLFALRPGWHLYWRNPGEAGIPPDAAWTVPRGWTIEGPAWPAPETFDGGGVVGYGYEESLLLTYTITPAEDARPGETVTVGTDVMWLTCRDVCIPGMASLTLKVPVTEATPLPSRFHDTFEEVEHTLPKRDHDWRLRASRTDDRLILVIEPGKQPDLPPNATIAFFPSEPGLIGSSVGPLQGIRPASVTLAFEAITDQHRSLNTLRGVLVLTGKGQEPERHALDVTVPIETEPNKGRHPSPSEPKER